MDEHPHPGIRDLMARATTEWPIDPGVAALPLITEYEVPRTPVTDLQTEAPTHFCITGNGCRSRTVNTDGITQPAITENPGTLCEGCRSSHRSQILRLATDYEMLRATLGERRTQNGAPVSASRNPGMPIDATSERLMTEILEWAGYAADLIATALKIPRPDASRKLAEIRLDDGRDGPPAEGSVADMSWENTLPPEEDRLHAFLAIVAENVDVLAARPREAAQIWAQPKRCEQHAEQIIVAKRMLELARTIRHTGETTEALQALHRAFIDAGRCNECCGWSDDGRYQARQVVEISGLDVLHRLLRLHGLCREHLGHTKLRHRYAMPCPRCGSPVGRDDGTTIVTCENNNCIKTNGRWGPSSWTEREYEFLSGMIVDEVTSKWLLAEAYVQLDGVQKLLADLRADERFNTSEAVLLILDAIDPIIAGHQSATDRRIATDKATAQKRQDDQDQWAWKRQPTYQKPKRKPRQQPAESPYAASSLTTLTDINLNTTAPNGICGTCHLTRPCDCEETP